MPGIGIEFTRASQAATCETRQMQPGGDINAKGDGKPVKTSEMQLAMAVRDYECDLQGVVNNAVYQNYLEHARHEFLKAHGLDFAAMTRAGINLVVVRAELDYRAALTSGDAFTVCTSMQQVSRLKFAFHQSITRQRDGKLMLDALITGTGVNAQGRPFLPEALLPLMAELNTVNH
jgi:acyl-CoA thioester hydrolase